RRARSYGASEELLGHYAGDLMGGFEETMPGGGHLGGDLAPDVRHRPLCLFTCVVDEAPLLELCLADDLLDLALRVGSRMVKTGGMLGSHPLHLGRDRPRLGDRPLGARSSLPDDAQG